MVTSTGNRPDTEQNSINTHTHIHQPDDTHINEKAPTRAPTETTSVRYTVVLMVSPFVGRCRGAPPSTSLRSPFPSTLTVLLVWTATLLLLCLPLPTLSQRSSTPYQVFGELFAGASRGRLTSLTHASEIDGELQYYQSPFSGGALPKSDRANFTIDVRLMLPHKDDDIDACSTPWRTSNEFNQTFVGAFLLLRQSGCSRRQAQNVAASGAAGIIVYGCPTGEPYNCPTTFQPFWSTEAVLPILAILAEDGERIVDYIHAQQAVDPPSSQHAVLFTAISTGTLDPIERAALVTIMEETYQGSLGTDEYSSALPVWSLENFKNTEYDPCRRTQGIVCEGNHIVNLVLLVRRQHYVQSHA